MDKVKKFLLIFIILVALLPFVKSAPPVTTTQQFTEGYELRIPQDNILKVGQSYDFEIHVFNISNGYPIISGVSCSFNLYNQTGEQVLQLNDATASGWDYDFLVSGGNFSTNGAYFYNVQCNSSTLGGYHSSILYVYPNGEEATSGRAIFYIGLLFVLIFFFGVGIYFLTTTENLLVKVGSFGISYILLVGLTFIGWNMSNDFLTSAPIISEILRILFIVLMIGSFFVLIGSFIWYFLMLFKIKEINRLMEKGVPYDEAEKRTGEKYK